MKKEKPFSDDVNATLQEDQLHNYLAELRQGFAFFNCSYFIKRGRKNVYVVLLHHCSKFRCYMICELHGHDFDSRDAEGMVTYLSTLDGHHQDRPLIILVLNQKDNSIFTLETKYE